MTMEQFFTAQAAEEGVEIPLYLPTGEKSEFFIRIRGIDSEKFRIAEAHSKRAAVTIAAIDNDDQRTKTLLAARVKLAASLVISWNLPDECSQANVEKLFTNAPQILEMVDRIASQRSLFFSRKQSASTDGLPQSSSSTKSRKNQVRR